MAGPYYVRSGASGGGTGADWTNAFTTLAAAYAAGVAGDTFYVAHDHAEAQGSAMTLTSPGTPAAPCKVLCVDDAAEPPTTLAATAVISTTGNYSITNIGSTYFYGIIFRAGNSTGTASLAICSGTASMVEVFDTCKLELLGTATGSRIGLCDNSRDGMAVLINTVLKFSHASQKISTRGIVNWFGGSLDTTVAIPTSLFEEGTAFQGIVTVRGVDFSTLNTALTVLGNQSYMKFYFQNCKLHASVTAKTATAIIGPQAEQVIIDNCDSGDTNYKINHVKYEGSIVTETTIKRTDGASDGTTGFCWKMVSLATPQLFYPLASPPIAIWNESTGSPMTLTVQVVHDSLTALTDAEIWVEVEYLGTSGVPLSLFSSDRVASVLAIVADQAASTVTWTTTGITNVNKQKLVATFTPQEKGPIVARVMLAKASYTVYVCPKVTVA
jgi:hypothetical protein